jgi:glutamate dehydrogenase (NADP+)
MYDVDNFMAELESRNSCEPEFIQAAKEVIESVIDVANDVPAYRHARVLERLTEPDRVITFKVEWEDDTGKVQLNRGCRVQFNNLLGPYKGGLRFHANVTLGSLKFLAFEQTLKNSLTTLPMGGGKGGADFSPRGKSDSEIRRFCRAFMSELQKHIGAEIDIPAGDIGVGGREIGYLYGLLKRLHPQNSGVLTGKGLNWGGSLLRPEATGFGAVYYAEEMLKEANAQLAGKTIGLSGFGNVAWGVAIKASELGAKVVTLSGPDGYVFDRDGVGTKEKWDYLLELRSTNNDVIAPYAEKFGAEFHSGKKPWETKVDMAFPCAIQNELNEQDAEALVENGCTYVVEVSNMGCKPDAIATLQNAGVTFAPGKAANAGGVAVSGLEMSQNSMKLRWTAEEVDEKLKRIMKHVHDAGIEHGRRSDGYIDYLKGSNVAGFLRVADAMLDQGF